MKKKLILLFTLVLCLCATFLVACGDGGSTNGGNTGGGGENNIMIFATGHDSSNKAKQVQTKVVNTGWQNWVQYEVEVPVTSGQATIGIYLDTNPGNWGNFDDVEFYLSE